MRVLTLLLVLQCLLAACGFCGGAGVTVGIDFEVRPAADLSKITNCYIGDSKYLYAFLVVKQDSMRETDAYVTAYDIG